VLDHLAANPQHGFVPIVPLPTLTEEQVKQFVRDMLTARQVEFAETVPSEVFNQLMRDLENDFYVAEVKPGDFDFASGLIKQWWSKYYA
jgi:hypothetical protein